MALTLHDGDAVLVNTTRQATANNDQPTVSILSENRHYPEFDEKNTLLDQPRRSYLLVAWKH